MKNAPKRNTKDLARSYEPTPHERAALEAHFARKEVNPPAPRLKVAENDGATTISPDHPEPRVGLVLLMDALGTTDWDFLEGLLLQLADAGSKGGVDGQTLNFMLSVVKGVEPRDQVEAIACRPNGRRSHGDHDIRGSACACGDHSAARECGACPQ
jgi:hypothetical protein